MRSDACLQYKAVLHQVSDGECHCQADLCWPNPLDYRRWWLDWCESSEVFGSIYKTNQWTNNSDEVAVKQRTTRSSQHRHPDSNWIECRFHCANGCWRHQCARPLRDANEFLQTESECWHPRLQCPHFQRLNVHSLQWENHKLPNIRQAHQIQSAIQLLPRPSDYRV